VVGGGAGAELGGGAGAGAELGGAGVGGEEEPCEPELFAELDGLGEAGEPDELPALDLAAWPACAVGWTPAAAARVLS
jgi:hypothetical protein